MIPTTIDRNTEATTENPLGIERLWQGVLVTAWIPLGKDFKGKVSIRKDNGEVYIFEEE